jgi:hypothetical protein
VPAEIVKLVSDEVLALLVVTDELEVELLPAPAELAALTTNV